MSAPKLHVIVRSSSDILQARLQARQMAIEIGFNGTAVTHIVTVVSDLARNLLNHTEVGEIALVHLAEQGRRGLAIEVNASKPGTPDFARQLIEYPVAIPFEVSKEKKAKGLVLRLKKWIQ